MKCIAFPKMFNGNSTLIYDDKKKDTRDKSSGTLMHLLLGSESGELLGDPDFGVSIRRYYFNQNSYVLRDIVIDELYTKIVTFMPNLQLDRKNITITQRGTSLYATIVCKCKDDYTTNMFDLVLFNDKEES